MNSVPHPDKDPDDPEDKRRRPSHFRKRGKDDTTKVLRVQQDDEPRSKELWAGIANDPPPLPDPPLHRRTPPPAPLPAEPPTEESFPPPWNEDQQRLRRIEEAVGTIGLAILVAAMVVAMWLRMTGG